MGIVNLLKTQTDTDSNTDIRRFEPLRAIDK